LTLSLLFLGKEDLYQNIKLYFISKTLYDVLTYFYSLIELLNFDMNLKALRILRVVRPLRSMKAFPSIRKQISTLIRALPELASTTVFLLFIMVLLSILGLQ
jgi:hypothetical protein